MFCFPKLSFTTFNLFIVLFLKISLLFLRMHGSSYDWLLTYLHSGETFVRNYSSYEGYGDPIRIKQFWETRIN
ncbi:hypothetical protein EDC94DRAFT_615682 [Helicostylum pulchrum]|nr:hypothetical protein EDC94DRAFT_615682 [Helicostylum pulchrum]